MSEVVSAETLVEKCKFVIELQEVGYREAFNFVAGFMKGKKIVLHWTGEEGNVGKEAVVEIGSETTEMIFQVVMLQDHLIKKVVPALESVAENILRGNEEFVALVEEVDILEKALVQKKKGLEALRGEALGLDNKGKEVFSRRWGTQFGVMANEFYRQEEVANAKTVAR